MRRQFERTGATADRDQAVDAYRRAVEVVTAPTSLRAQAARRWGEVAAVGQDWVVAVEGYAAAVGLLARVAPRSLARPDQEFWLGEFSGLGANAAACCLQAGQPERAVELWEQGRGVLLGQALDTRTDLTDLAARHPRLAAEFVRVRDELDYLPATPDMPTSISGLQVANISPGGDGWAAVRAAIDRRQELADQFERVVAEVQAQPDFGRFLRPTPIRELLAVAEPGPVVVVIVSEIRSDALLLTPSGVQVVPLPQLTPQRVLGQVLVMTFTLAQVADPTIGLEARVEAERRLAEVLQWLWDGLAGPVLKRLGLTQAPKPDTELAADGWPRLWWCPSGLLGFLPLHAAGHHATRFDPVPQTVLDRAISSYTPTVRALIHARHHPTPAHSNGDAMQVRRLLIVAMPHTPARRDLPEVVEEAALLRDLFPGQTMILHGDLRPDEAARLIDPDGAGAEFHEPQANFDRVQTALPRCNWAHFACHADSNLDDPSASYLLLADHQHRPLTVLDLTRLRWLRRFHLAPP